MPNGKRPSRPLLVLLGLFVVCLAIVLIAWAADFYLYMYVPSRSMEPSAPPPTHPVTIIVFLLTGGGLLLYAPRLGLIVLTGLLGTILLGTIVGYLAFAWTPTLVQWLLTAAMSVQSIYGWTKFGNRFD